MKRTYLALAAVVLTTSVRAEDSFPSPWKVVTEETRCNLDRDLTKDMWVQLMGGKKGSKDVAVVFPGATLPDQTNGSTFGVILETPPSKFTQTKTYTQAVTLSDQGRLLTAVWIDKTTLMLAFASNKSIKIHRQSDGVELVSIPMGPDGTKNFVRWSQCNANRPNRSKP